ncbi:MAG: hypothetical protein GX089_01360 [Fibrobacter sp.]|jgi:hypothetical protein|nr:hypothetical protein [Fibrobacter sp.]
MKKTGFSLLGSGGGLLALGIILMATAEWESYSNGTEVGMTTSDPQVAPVS